MMNWEILLTFLAVFASGTLVPIVIKAIEQRSQKPVVEAQSEEILSEAWERLAKEYARLLENARKLEVENAELRPLVLKLALQDKDMEQCRADKEDWKRYANKLRKQLEEQGIVPIAFQRYPGGGDSGKMEAIMNGDKKP